MKWRKIDRPDGSSEIVALIDREKLHQWPPPGKLGYERSICWLHPIETLDFVRVAYVRVPSRRKRLRVSDSGILFGYSTLVADAPLCPKSGAYLRRAFFLREEDQQRNMNQFPAGAVDPQTLLPGRPGKSPDRRAVERGYPWYLCYEVAPAQQSKPGA